MVNLELLINILARSALGLFSASALSFGIWWATWFSFNTSDLSLTLFFLVQASIVGVSAAVPTVFLWWNTQSSGRVHWLFIGVILGTTVVSAFVVNDIRGIETHNALVGGVLRVPVFSVSHMLSSMIGGAVLGGNAVAAVFYLYRALRHREI